MIEADDAELMLVFQTPRDYGAFEALLYRHEDMPLRLLARLSGNVAIAEDVSQPTWLKVIDVARPGGYTTRSDVVFRTWRCTLARTRFVDGFQREFAVTRTQGLPDDLENAANDRGDPLETLDRCEQAKRVDAALRQLPFEQREVIALWAADVGVDAIAAMIGARDTLLSRRKYAVAKLRHALAAPSAEESGV
jgi:DNA-directed RNA polymerase specialized sigma24 family protein